MKRNTLFFFLFSAIFILLTGCSEQEGNKPLSYDPPGSTDTRDKEISLQDRQTFAFESAGVFFSNDFAGGRLNAIEQKGEQNYTILIQPENAPINNSAWYAFKVWSAKPQCVQVELRYEDGRHRYIPKLSRDGETWQPIAPEKFSVDTTRYTALLQLDISRDTLWVAAQELITTAQFNRWIDGLAGKPYVSTREIGRSHMGRPIRLMEISEAPDARKHVLIISRQHPPEVTGSLALMAFVEKIAGESALAARFRKQFAVKVIPLMNPDGVDEGHWRHNARGVDLNRDWYNFNQPETRAARDEFLKLKDNPENRVYFGIDFHSTQEDIFYTLAKDLKTVPEGLTDRWLDKIRAHFPDYALNEDPGGLGSPVSKNWFYREFQAASVTYESGDESDRQALRELAAYAAEAMMETLLESISADNSR